MIESEDNNTNPTPVIRLLIVDDHYIARAGLIALLKHKPDFVVVGEAVDGLEAIKAFERLRPTVTLMDLRMPNLGGIEAARQIRSKYSTARILVLSAFHSDEDIYRSLQAGVCGYCLKGAPPSELYEAIATVASGRRYIPPSIAASIIERINIIPLTEREREVLSFMSKGLTNQQIGNFLSISEGTVKSHVNRILTKMNADDRTAAVVSALKRGLVTLE